MITDAELAAAYAEVGEEPEPGELARAIRKRAGFSQKEVASRIGAGTHFTTISKLEKGTMSFTYEWARTLAGVFGVSASIFHMPYDMRNTARKVPVFNSLSDLTASPRAAPDNFAAFLTTSERLFGFGISGLPDIVSYVPFYILIVDPDRTELSAGWVYLFQLDDSDEAIAGMYRNDGGIVSVVPWPRSGDPVSLTEKTKVNVLGKVLEAQRVVASRNR